MSWSREDDGELHERLEDYFNFGVVVAKAKSRRSKALLLSFIAQLREEIEHLYNFPEGQLFDVKKPVFYGNLWTDQAIVNGETFNGETFDVIFPLNLDPDDWDCYQIADLNDSASYGQYRCHLKEYDYDGNVDEILLQYGVDPELSDDLDPCCIKDTFEYWVQTIVSSSEDVYERFTCSLIDSPDPSFPLALQIQSVDFENIIIIIRISPALLIHKSQAEYILLQPEGYSWIRSFAADEKRLLERKDAQDGGCRRMIFRILKSLAADMDSPLWPLDADTLKNAVLATHDTMNWRKYNLAECFRKMLTYLKECCKVRMLPRYFENDHNILKDYSNEILDNICNSLQEIEQNGNYLSFFVPCASGRTYT